MPGRPTGRPLTLRIEGHDLPGRSFEGQTNVRVGLQVRKENTELQPGDSREVAWEAAISVVTAPGGAVDFRGPVIQGRAGERFVYLSWIGRGEKGDAMFRRAKLQLDAVPEKVLADALAAGKPLVGRLALTDWCGGPRCASVRPPAIVWKAGR